MPDPAPMTDLVPGALVLALLVLVPGGLALRLLGVRGLAALAGAPPVSLAGLGLLSILLPLFGLPWRLPVVAATLAVLLTLLWAGMWLAGRRLLGAQESTATPAPRGDRWRAGDHGRPEDHWRPQDQRRPGDHWRPGPLGRRGAVAVAAGVLTGFVLLAAPVVSTLPSPEFPLQQWDGVFHLNAIVTVRETGTVSPFGGLAPLYGAGTLAPYYPTGWHALVALAPGEVVTVTNAGIVVLGAGVWALGLAGVAREVFWRRTLPAAVAPLLAATFVAFPVVQLTVLAQLPNGLATALLPGALALVVRAPRAVQARAGARAVTACVAAAVLATTGVVVAHASGAFSMAVLAGPLVGGALGGWAVRQLRAGRRAAGSAVLALLAVGVVVLPVLLTRLDALSPVIHFERASGRTHAAALREVLLDQTLVHSYPGDGAAHLAVTVATLAGVALTFVRGRHRWLAVGFGLAVGLAVLASGPEDHPLRWLSAFWYTQAGRIAPVAVVPAVLLAGYAGTALVDGIRRRTGERAGQVALVGVLAVTLVTAGLRLPLQERVVASAFIPGDLAWGTMASVDELVMMRRLELPPDAVVVGDPFNGSALLPAVAGVDVVFPQLGASGMSPAQQTLQDNLARIHQEAEVCAALDEIGATHLYQDTADEGAKVNERTEAMREVDVTTGFTEVDRAGSAAVYRIEACT